MTEVKVNDTYDITEAFEAIENELIASMIRNMKRHKLEEVDEDKQWSMWQAEELKSLEKYRRSNKKKFGTEFGKINSKIDALIRAARDEGEMEQEIAILDAIKKGFKAKKAGAGATAEFFKLNERKLDALIEATVNDMEKAEVAILRRANDQYRKVIYNAQVYANTGAGTYEKAVDMATKDMLSAGLQCVQYANGAMHTLSDYADMALRTATKRAYLQGEGKKRQEWGISTVIMNKRGNPCPLCLPFVGKILIDDVWSNGPSDGISPVTGKKYPLMSKAVEAGLYHPRCRDVHTTYFEGLDTKPDDKFTKKEIDDIAEKNKKDAKLQYAARQEKKFQRMSDFSIDPDNKKAYSEKQKQWKHVRLKTGDIDKTQYLQKQMEDKFLGIPKDITSSWTLNNGKAGTVSELTEYIEGNEIYKVDGKKVLLDYSDHEKEVAEVISELYGKNVQMVPRVTYPQGISTPDFKIDGIGWDLKTISTAGKNVLYNSIKKKKRQANCFIFDITNCPLEMKEIKRQVEGLFRTTHLTSVENVAIYKDGCIIGVYERNKK